MNFGFRGVTAAALLPGRMRPLTDVARLSTVSSGMSYIEIAVGQSELGAAASRKAVWWDLRLASPLTHLLFFKLRISSVLTHNEKYRDSLP